MQNKLIDSVVNQCYSEKEEMQYEMDEALWCYKWRMGWD